MFRLPFPITALALFVVLFTPGERLFSAPSKKLVFLVVVSPQRKESNISMAELRNIYLGKKTHWETGDSIFPVLPPKKSGEPTSVFLTRALSMEPGEFKRQWQNRVASGATAAVPEEYAGMKETLRALGRTGAIVVIPAVNTVRFRQYIKVLTIDGKKSTDAGYPLAFEP